MDAKVPLPPATYFTPGPWWTYLHDPLVIVNGDGASLGEAVPGDPTISRREALANAQLWAAAPDLFEAVDQLIEHAQPDNWDDAEEGVAHANAWRRAFNALAKATGRPAPYVLADEDSA